jgi:hypothetical protein
MADTLDMDGMRRDAEEARDRNHESMLRLPVYSYSCLNPEYMIALLDRLAAAERVVEAARPILNATQKLVAGWQRDPEMPRHPPSLGWQPEKSQCGVAYSIADALAAYDRAKED